jgi:hypothetical protein
MLSMEKCNEVLNKNQQKYSKEEVKAIRDYLYGYARIIDLIKNNNEGSATR